MSVKHKNLDLIALLIYCIKSPQSSHFLIHLVEFMNLCLHRNCYIFSVYWFSISVDQTSNNVMTRQWENKIHFNNDDWILNLKIISDGSNIVKNEKYSKDCKINKVLFKLTENDINWNNRIMQCYHVHLNVEFIYMI